jgi:ribonuclease J
MAESQEDFVFLPLGGIGEIGMNAALYGYGPKGKRKWIMVDCGLSFAGPDLPGIDLIMPDTAFIEKMKKDLVGIVITHAHEDHIGAIADLWPRLGCPVYATKFAAGLLENKRLSEPGAPRVPIRVVAQGATLELMPFEIEFVPVAHSIPEASALAIRTPTGTVVHTGDWKLDDTPGVGPITDSARLKAIGDEGVLALVCDSTNILRDGVSPSEGEVAAELARVIAGATKRVIVTTFASNVARIRAVALAAEAAGRKTVLVGRAMERVVAVARECGYLEDVPTFLSMHAFGDLPRDRIVVLATGSQGEPRAALSRIAQSDHPTVKLTAGDTVVFSSRTIPGNEREVNRIVNGLIRQGVEVVTDRTHLVHCSGHPRRGEVAQMYDWLRPRIAAPAHGEALHLDVHAHFAKARGVGTVIPVENGDLVKFGPGDPGVVEQAPSGRLYKDGEILVAESDEAVGLRRKLAFAGVISVAIGVTAKGDLAGDPDVVIAGVPARARKGAAMDEIVDEAIFRTLDGLPRQRRRDADVVSTAVEKAVRAAVNAAWGKKPLVHVLVVEV